MTDNVENLILEPLRGLRAGQDRIEHELRELQGRITSLEGSTVALRREAVHTDEDQLRQQISIDAIKGRLSRIEKRLELS